MLIKIINGSVCFGADTILEEINFEVKDKEKIAIVGRNGSGKTTLLRAILGEVELEEGVGEENFQYITEGSPKIGYVKQDSINFDDTTLLEEILKCYSDIINIEKRIKILEKKMENFYDENVLNEYHNLLENYRYKGGYTYKKEYEEAIYRFGFSEEDKCKKLSEFSGGQRTKITLLRLLLSKPDILLLDEPTNHLDIETIEWLEDYLREYKKSLVVISHDRMFLDRVVSIVYEISYGCLNKYRGNYSLYLKQREENYNKQLKDYEYQQKEIKRLNRIVERFKYKPSKASMAMSKLKQIEHMVKVEKPDSFDVRTFKANFVPKVESYREVLKIKNLNIGYDKSLKVINLLVEKGDKIGIIGNNGSGKSTFLKTIVGSIPPVSGKLSFGERVEIGYFDQEMTFSNLKNTVYEEISLEYPDLTVNEVRNALGAFEFRGEEVFKNVIELSGGERVRLMLCKIMLKKPNLLILDEPTNHLDMIGKESLEKVLNSYNGTLIFVSHDRYFVNSVSNKLLDFDCNPVEYYPYGYSEYLEKRKRVSYNFEKEDTGVYKKSNSKGIVNAKKENDKLIRRMKKIEDEISKLDNDNVCYNQELGKEEVYLDIEKSSEILSKIEDNNKRIKDLESEWDKISEMI